MPDDFEQRLRAAMEARPPALADIPDARAAAVLIPIVGRPERSVIFTLRTDTLSSHRGQISFPGGSIEESDENPAAAALRESCEEIGIDPASVRILGELDTFPTYVSGYAVTPVVGWIDELPEFHPSPAEVARVIVVPLDKLGDEIRSEAGFTRGGRTYPTEAWIWEDNVIWGVTARVVRSFLELLAEAGLAPAPTATTSWDFPPAPAAR